MPINLDDLINKKFSTSSIKYKYLDEIKDAMKPQKKLSPTTSRKTELGKRVSVFSCEYPDAKEENWEFFKGAGWVHSIERDVFYERYIQCFISKKWATKNSFVSTENGDYVLEKEAIKSGYAKCPLSGYFFKGVGKQLFYYNDVERATITVSNQSFERHASRCSFSGDLWASVSITRTASRDYPRVSKYYIYVTKDFVPCDCCGVIYHRNDLEIRNLEEGHDYFGKKICDSCYNKFKFKDVIQPHNYAKYPKPIFSEQKRYYPVINDRGVLVSSMRKGEYSPDRLFGVEIETEMSIQKCKFFGIDRFSMAKECKEAIGTDFAITKEDGTLIENGKYSGGQNDPNGTGVKYAGFEIVTAPCDISVHRERWERFGQMKYHSALRAWDTSTCGMHVHVSRENLTYLQIAKILIFMNCRNNTGFVQKIAGRGSERFCRYEPKEPAHATRVDERTDENRRQAVNLCNSKTIEFRIFRGTVNPNHIIRNIEFCDAVVAYTHPGVHSFRDMHDHPKFIQFVAANKKQWPNLAGWFAFHKLMTVKPLNKKANKDKVTINLSLVAASEPEIKG